MNVFTLINTVFVVAVWFLWAVCGFWGFFAWSITWFFISSVFGFHHQYLKDSWAEMAFPVWPVWCVHQSPELSQMEQPSSTAAGTQRMRPAVCGGDGDSAASSVLAAAELTPLIHFPSSELRWTAVPPTGWAPNKEDQAGRALSVNTPPPRAWELGRNREADGLQPYKEEELLFPRVCGSDLRHDARCSTNSCSAPPSGPSWALLLVGGTFEGNKDVRLSVCTSQGGQFLFYELSI